jgi:anti-anti-sigma regulatory factor
LENPTVLRITRITASDGAEILKLEGKLLEPWVAELLHASAQSLAQSVRICLDLGAVSFVDAAGARALRHLLSQGITIAACSGFIAELLHVDQP